MANRKLVVVSNYLSNSWNLDDNNMISLSDGKVVDIDTMVKIFYNIPSVKCYGIITAYIWDVEERKIEKHITDLPDSSDKAQKNILRIVEITKQIKKLQEELEIL